MVSHEKVGNFRIRHLNGYISGTGSGSHMPFELDQWPYSSFQTSLSLSKSVQPSPRNVCGLDKVRNCRLLHLNGYISGTGSGSHMPFELDQWPNISFRTSLSLCKSVQPSPRNMRGNIENRKVHIQTHTHTHTHRHFPISSS